MHVTKKVLTGATAVGWLAAVAAGAQIQPAPYISVHHDEVDPASAQTFEGNAKEWVAAFSAAGLGAEYGWRAYSADFGYVWVSDMPDFAYLDSAPERQAAVVEAVGEEAFAKLVAGVAAVTNHETEVWKFEPELSYGGEDFDPAGMTAINVGRHHVKPSMGEQYKAVVKDVVAALGKVDAPIHFFAYSIQFGDGSYGYVSFGENRSALHSGPQIGALLAQAEGPEGAQALYQRWVESISGVDEKDYAVRPELSFVPGAGMEKPAEGEGE